MAKKTASSRRARTFVGARHLKYEYNSEEFKNKVKKDDGTFKTYDELTADELEKVEKKWKKEVIKELNDFEKYEGNTKADGTKEGILELTYVFHGRDVEDNTGEKKGLHVHFVARFTNPRTYEKIREVFACNNRNFEVARSESSALLYLTHTTAEAIKAKKTRYNVSELYNYVLDEDSREIKRQIKNELEEWYRIKIAGKTGANKVNTDEVVAQIIDDLTEGNMTLDSVKDELKKEFDRTTATMTYVKSLRYFKIAVQEHNERKYQEWREHGRKFKLLYIEGKSGIGKTRFAKTIAERFNIAKGYKASNIHNAPNDSKGARYDFLSSYDNEAVTVFDDLKPTTFGYTEFLNLFEQERVAKGSSRFNDKPWFAELAIISKSTSIDEFTSKMSYSELADANTDSEKYNVLYQPRRRFNLVINIDDDTVKISNYKLLDKTNKHKLEVLEEIKAKKSEYPTDEELKEKPYLKPFHSAKFQARVLDYIDKYLGLKEATTEEVEALSPTFEVDEEQVNKLNKLIEKMEVDEQ